jgi:hypothetical protein
MAYQEGLERNEALLPFRELVFFPCMMYSWQLRGQRCPSCGIEQLLMFQAMVPKSILHDCKSNLRQSTALYLSKISVIML